MSLVIRLPALMFVVLLAQLAVKPACAAELKALMGPTIRDRCHGDFCGLANIQLSAPVAVLRDGTLFAISGQV